MTATLAQLRRIRPTRAAAGVSYNLERQRATRRKEPDHAVLLLAVKGTCDPLAATFRAVAKAKCPCCNGTGRSGFALSDAGKLKLRRLRRKRGGVSA